MVAENQWTVFFADDDEDDACFFETAVMHTHPDCLVARFKNFEGLVGGLAEHGSLERVIIFIDLALVTVDGIGVLAQIRDSPALDTSIVYILSACENPQFIQSAYEHSVNGYLFKPVTSLEWVKVLGPAILFAKNL